MKRFIKSPLVVFALVFGVVLFVGAVPKHTVSKIRNNGLRDAARDSSIFRARLFLFLGADVSHTTGGGTPLHIAAARGDTAMIEFLLSRGANPNATAKWSITPLYNSRIYRHLEAERILLAHGAHPDTSHIHPP